MTLLLGAGLTVISAAPASPTAWACAYVSARMPRVLALMGDDTVSAEETRAARKRLSLAEVVLTRASSLTLARALGASRLVTVRCLDGASGTTVEARAFDTETPSAGETIRVLRPLAEIGNAIDQVASRLVPAAKTVAFRSPSAQALSKAGPALGRENAAERALGLRLALDSDPDSIDLRLSTVEALIAARDFDAAIRLTTVAPEANTPLALARALRFQGGAALLEAGRYAEAKELFEALRRERETAAVLNNLGVARFRLRDPDASGLFERAAFFTDHRQKDVAFNRCLALLFESKADLAVPALDARLKADPTDVRARLLRVWALRSLNREAERGEEWDRLMAVSPSFSSLGIPDLARRLERIFFFERSPEA